MIEMLFSYLAPHFCFVCDAEGSVLCEACDAAEIPLIPSRCAGCYAPTRNSRVCAVCRPGLGVRKLWVRADYSMFSAQLITCLKFNHARSAATDIARSMASNLPVLPKDTLVVPLPTSTQRVRQRGFDQAELIARNLARIKKLTYAPLLRRQGTTRQVGSGRADRFTNMADAFWLAGASWLTPASSILLIDDVMTTGASLSAAARVFRAAGAQNIDAAVFAQKSLA